MARCSMAQTAGMARLLVMLHRASGDQRESRRPIHCEE
jgi:hypothetical protein